MWFLLERFFFAPGAWDGLRYVIVALPVPSYNYFGEPYVTRLSSIYSLDAFLIGKAYVIRQSVSRNRIFTCRPE